MHPSCSGVHDRNPAVHSFCPRVRPDEPGVCRRRGSCITSRGVFRNSLSRGDGSEGSNCDGKLGLIPQRERDAGSHDCLIEASRRRASCCGRHYERLGWSIGGRGWFATLRAATERRAIQGNRSPSKSIPLRGRLIWPGARKMCAPTRLARTVPVSERPDESCDEGPTPKESGPSRTPSRVNRFVEDLVWHVDLVDVVETGVEPDDRLFALVAPRFRCDFGPHERAEASIWCRRREVCGASVDTIPTRPVSFPSS